MNQLAALLLGLSLLAAPVFGAEGPQGHPYHLTVHNGSGDGDYYEGGEVPISADTPNGYQFLMWIKSEGAGSHIATFSPNTTLTMGSSDATITAVFAKLDAWFPPGPEGESKGLLLPKDPSAQHQPRFEHHVRVSLNRGEGSDEVTPEEVWGYLSVQVGWFPTQECEGIWHSNELVRYWTQQQSGQELSKDQVLDKKLFDTSSDVSETSVWYEGNWTLAQLASKVDGSSDPVLPKAYAGFKLKVNWKDFHQVKSSTSGTLLPPQIKQLNYPTTTDTTDLGPTTQKLISLDGNGIAYIIGVPEMPQLKASLGDGTLSGATVEWRMEVKTERSERGTKDDKNYPASGYKTLPINQAWDIGTEFGSDFVGGKCKLFYKINNIPERTIEFKIRGKNPMDGDAKSHIQEGSYWFAWGIAQHESRQGDRVYNQFNSGGDGPGNLELPNYSADGKNGWGVFQRDDTGDEEDHPVTTNEVYDWHYNTTAAFEELGRKQANAERYIRWIRNKWGSNPNWEEPPNSYSFFGQNFSAVELATMVLYNGAAGIPWVPCQNDNGDYAEVRSPWSFDPNKPAGQRWTFHDNTNPESGNHYAETVTKDELNGDLSTTE